MNKKTRHIFFMSLCCVFFSVFSADGQSILTKNDVNRVIDQAVSIAASQNRKITVAVADKEGNIRGIFQMTGANMMTLIRSVGTAGQGLENRSVPSTLAAHSKAGTAAILSSGGNAFSTRTASFIIQEHFPPGIDNRVGGPLYGVQFSTLSCSDIAIAGMPLGLSGDPGGIPLYKNGDLVGGVGIEGDGFYTVDRVPTDDDQTYEEVYAVAASRGFEVPPLIRADNILVEGIRLAYANVNINDVPIVPTVPTTPLDGVFVKPVIVHVATDFTPATLRGVSGQMSSRFPTVAGSTITLAEVNQILGDAVEMANITRGAIRQPLGSNARVTTSVVDLDGNVLGIFQQLDAPIFGLDVAVQKARTAVFFTRPDAASKLTAALPQSFGSYVTRANADGISLAGGIALSNRALGFVHRPLFPDGINNTPAGFLSTELSDWSPFNVGLQLDLVQTALLSSPIYCSSRALKKRKFLSICPCTSIHAIRNGIQIFAGGIPLYRGTTLIGAIGISGDGIEQDDFIAAAGANNFAPPVNIRSDKFFVRGVRLPFLKFPARPTLP